MVKKSFKVMVIILVYLCTLVCHLCSQEEKVFTREQLIQDTRQLAQILEETHPDPYINGGGKIAFHRRLQQTLRAVPKEGMTKLEFYKLLLPFVAAVGDGHTRISLPRSDQPSLPGIPLQFNIVEHYLYVSGVYDKIHEPLFGAVLAAVEGIPFEELVVRQERLWGCENEYDVLLQLARSFSNRGKLESLLPEWQDKDKIKVTLKSPADKENEYTLTLSEKMPEDIVTPHSSIQLPSTDKVDFVYDFLNPEKSIAILRVDAMFYYRENLESAQANGATWVKRAAKSFYERFHGTEAPEKVEDIIAAIPSTTETFKSLAIEMKEANTQTLIIDIRKNGGGSSSMTQMLIYFMHGKKIMESLDSGYPIKKYSDLYFKNYTSDNLDKINENQPFPLIKDDYDFKYDPLFRKEEITEEEKEKRAKRIEEYYKSMPTLWEEVKTGKYDGHYLPEKVIVLCSPWTYSSGFMMMVEQYRLGATIIGTPSGQAGNCFGDILPFKLDNTSIQGYISHKQFVEFPDNPEKGKVFRPHYELTYEKLASYNFDPNAEVLYALEILEGRK